MLCPDLQAGWTLLYWPWSEQRQVCVFFRLNKGAMIDVCIKRGNNWHGMIMEFQCVIVFNDIVFNVFPLHAQGRCAKGTRLI